jgi:putative peptide zinc metalloprotease protein
MSDLSLLGFQTFPLDTLEGKNSYLLVGKNGAQVRLSSSAYQLLRAVDEGTSFDDLAQQIKQAQRDSTVSKDQLEQAYRELIQKLNQIDERAQQSRLPWAFWVRLPLFPERWVSRISSILALLYHPYLLPVLLAWIAVTFAFMFHGGMRLELKENSFLWGYCLFLGSLIIHEFGHSSACARYGARPSDIGFTIYLIYPAFYSDVSSAWQLRRWQRVMVDLGGNYFQFLIGSSFILAFYGTHWEPFRLAVLMIVSTAVFSLNPIFKFDGYWMLADFLGVTNLASQPARIGSYFYNRILGRKPRPLPWPMKVAGVLIIYSLISFAVWALFLWNVVPMVWHRALQFSHSVNLMWAYVQSRHRPSWAEFRTFLISVFLLGISLSMLWQMIKRFGKIAFRRLSPLREKFHNQQRIVQPESPR